MKTRMKDIPLVWLFAAALITAPFCSLAQSPDSSSAVKVDVPASEAEGSTPTLSGYPEASGMEMGDSVTEDLAQDDRDLGGVLSFPRVEKFFQPWFDWKRNLNDKYGLKLQMSYQALYQEADESPGEDIAAAGRGEINGSWTLLGRGTKNPGMLTFRLEHRQAYGSKIPPSKLGAQFGSVTQTGSGFSDFGTNLSELAWRQTVLDGKLKIGFGKISALGWYNGMILSSPKRGFQNTALLSSLTKPAVGRGLGLVGGLRIGSNYGLVAGIHDANAKTAENPFDSIDEWEFFKSLEFRWLPTTYDRRRWDQVRLHVWQVDEREKAGIPSGQGVTFTATKLINDRWMPFLLGGYSSGGGPIFKADVLAGVGIGFNTRHRAARDVLGFGVGWGRPPDESLQDQITSEIFYRFTLVQNFVITPSVQYIINPAKNPEETEVTVLSLRGRLTF